MSQINSLLLKNFKCFENQKLDFSSLTLFTGINGLGKSTAIQSLLLLRQSYDANTLLSTGLTLNGDLVEIGTGRDALFEAAQVEEISFRINSETGKEFSWDWTYEKDYDLLPTKFQHSSEQMLELDLFSNQLVYLKAERISPQAYYRTSQYKVRQLKQVGIKGEYSIQFLSIFGEMSIPNDKLIHYSAKSRSLKAQVDAWMSIISPGTRLSVLDLPEMDLVSLRYQFVGSKELSNSFRPQNVGFGLTNVLPVIIAILSATPGTTLIIENPEAHLHPKGQAQLGKLISLAASGGVQIIIETHSDHVINGIRLAVYEEYIEPGQIKIHFFERDPSQDFLRTNVVSPKIDKNGRLDYWPEDFFDQWEKSLDALLEPKEGENKHWN